LIAESEAVGANLFDWEQDDALFDPELEK